MRYPVTFLVGFMFAVAAAPAQVTRLSTGSGGGERMPVLSANGETVAFVAFVGSVRELFTVPSDGGTPTRRTTGGNLRLGASIYDAWPSLSISDDGQRIAYWNAGGVHIVDLVAATDRVVATASLLPYPQISDDGAWVVYEDLVGTDMEVFVVAAGGGTPQQLTSASGPGRRLPHLRGGLVVMQRNLAGTQELFVYDRPQSKLNGPLSANSGRGNRYARLAYDARSIAYEAVVNTNKELFTYEIASGNRRQVSTAALRGDRIAMPTQDGEAFYQLPVGSNLEVHAVDVATSAQLAVTTSSLAGHRRPSIDRHGAVVVYQAEYQGQVEVFARRFCQPVTVSHYGPHGPPSTGVLTELDRQYRRTLELGIDSSLPQGRSVLLLVGGASLNLPIQGAPGNFLHARPDVALTLQLDANGTASLALLSPTVLFGASLYAQWAIADPTANSLGWVTSKGVRLAFR